MSSPLGLGKTLSPIESVAEWGFRMKCPKCGADNADGKLFCGDCGSELKKSPIKTTESSGTRGCVSCGRPIDWNAKFCKYCGHAYEEGATGAPKSDNSPAGGQNRTCVRCGRIIDWDANFCQYCGYDFRVSGGANNGWVAVAGGILLIIASSLGLIGAIINFIEGEIGVSAYVWYYGYSYAHYKIALWSGVSGLILFPMGIIGGAFAIAKRHWGVSLLLSIPAVIANILLIISLCIVVLFAIPALIMGIIGLSLIAVSSKQFTH